MRRVDVEDLDKLEVLEDALDEHPAEGDEEEVVQQGGHGDAALPVLRLVDAGQDKDVDGEKGQGKVEQDELGPTRTHVSP